MFFSVILGACSKEDTENTITVKFYSNSDTAPVYITGGGTGEPYLIVKKKWENTYTTENDCAGFDARCDDMEVLLTGEIYVNGKLKQRKYANGLLIVGYCMRGNGY